jgi:hypothetical protein
MRKQIWQSCKRFLITGNRVSTWRRVAGRHGQGPPLPTTSWPGRVQLNLSLPLNELGNAMSLDLFMNDTCPRCRKPIKLAVNQHIQRAATFQFKNLNARPAATCRPKCSSESRLSPSDGVERMVIFQCPYRFLPATNLRQVPCLLSNHVQLDGSKRTFLHIGQ